MSAAPWLPALQDLPAAPRPPLVFSGVAAIERDWKRLQYAARPANPFLSWEWQSAWAALDPRGARPLVLAETFPDGSLAGLLALQRRRRHGLAQLELLGQGAGGDELDCLLHPAAPPELAPRLLALALARPGWSLLRLESVRAAGALAAALAPAGAAAEPGEWLPYLSLPSSFEALLAAHSPNFRSEVRRRRRAFARLAPDSVVECAETPAAVGTALTHLFRLHNLRRAHLRGRGLFSSSVLRDFHRRAALQLAAAGAARIYLLRTPAAVIAALYGFAAGASPAARFHYFQSGFDPAWTAASPGTVLLSAVIEDCIARGLAAFEFLRGEEPYKHRWTTLRRRSQSWNLARGPLGRAFLELRRWRARLRT
ncbi:MAG: GNAT family N-acetyltransferase [Terriglobales bacterium]